MQPWHVDDYCDVCWELWEECLCLDLDDYEAMRAEVWGDDEDDYGTDSWDFRL